MEAALASAVPPGRRTPYQVADRRGLAMTGMVNLRPLSGNSEALTMILLARGQLNRACRLRVLDPPDALPVPNPGNLDVVDLDDPAGRGLRRAELMFAQAFAQWSAEFSEQLASPVLAMLRQTLETLRKSQTDRAAIEAVEQGIDYLLQQVSSRH